MRQIAFQDSYPNELSHCYGCGKNNEYGHQLKSFWANDNQDVDVTDLGATTCAKFTPAQYHTALPGFVYGGILASLIDCHGTASASAIAYRQAGRVMTSKPALRFVTAALKVNYLAPTPIGVELAITGNFIEVKPKKVVVKVTIFANDIKCAEGDVIAVLMPETMSGS